MRVYLSLGSNLGDSAGNIRQALEQLSVVGCKVQRVSSFYKTEPVDVPEQPWFINCVAEAETILTPRALLRAVLACERALGRKWQHTSKGPRTIDIDILLYEDLVVDLPRLKIPHPGLGARRFVLVPLKEIAAEVQHPVTKQTVSHMLRDTTDTSKVVKLKKKTMNAE